MTEIKVERDDKGGIPWWVWALLALLLIAALLWWLLDDGDEAEPVREPVVAEAVVVPVGTDPNAGNNTGNTVTNGVAGNQMGAAAAGGPITDASMLYSGINDSMVGRQVQLTGVPVLEVVGDAGFWVGESQDRRVFVMLNEQRTPNTKVEGGVDVNQGQRVTLSGAIRNTLDGAGNIATGSTAELPQGVNHFVIAEQVQVQS